MSTNIRKWKASNKMRQTRILAQRDAKYLPCPKQQMFDELEAAEIEEEEWFRNFRRELDNDDYYTDMMIREQEFEDDRRRKQMRATGLCSYNFDSDSDSD
jgi:hypothetical protein